MLTDEGFHYIDVQIVGATDVMELEEKVSLGRVLLKFFVDGIQVVDIDMAADRSLSWLGKRIWKVRLTFYLIE